MFQKNCCKVLLVQRYFLALDLEPVVIWVLVVWSVLSLAYYPLRKRLLARQGKDLEAQMTDTKIFSI